MKSILSGMRRFISETKLALFVGVAVILVTSYGLFLNHRALASNTVQITSPTANQTVTAQNPGISGTGPANKVLRLFIDGVAVGSPVQIDGNGNWTYTATGLSETTHTVRAVVLDGTAYVSNSNGLNSYGQLNLNNNVMTAKVGGICYPNNPQLDTAHSQLYLNDSCSSKILIFDTTNKVFKAPISYNPNNTHTSLSGASLYLDVSNNRLYVAGSGKVLVINTLTNTITKTVSGTSGSTYHIAPSPTSAKLYLYTSNPVIGTLDIYDVATDTISNSSVNANITIFRVAPDGQYAYYQVFNSSSVIHKLNLTSMTDSATLNVGSTVIDFVVSNDSSKLYVSNNTNSLLVYPTSTLVQSASLANSGGTRLTMNHAGNKMYGSTNITNLTNNTTISSGLSTGEGYVDASDTYFYQSVQSGLASHGSTTIKIYNANSGALVNTLSNLRASAGTSVIFDTANNAAYSINTHDQSITEINTSTQAVVNSYGSGLSDTVANLIKPDGSKLYVAGTSSGAVNVVNPVTGALLSVIHLSGIIENSGMVPPPLAFNADASYLYAYVRDWNSPSTAKIIKINTSTDTITSSLGVTSALQTVSMLINETENSAYISSFTGGIVQINLTTGATIRTIGAAQAPNGVGRMLFNADHSKLFTVTKNPVANDSALQVDISSHTVTQSVALGRKASDIGFSTDFSKLYVATVNGINNYVESRNPSDLSMNSSSTAIADSSTGLGLNIAPNGWIYASDDAGTLRVIDPAAWSIVTSSSYYDFTNPQPSDIERINQISFNPTDITYSEASVSFTLVIPVSITNTSLPPAYLDEPYSTQLNTTGSHSAVSYSIVAGSLPSGVTLNQSSGLISGTPTVAGSNLITFKVTDSVSNSSKQLSLDVVRAKPASDLLGQLDGSNQPIWDQSGDFNNTWSANAYGFQYLQSIKVDTVHHRLFTAECGQRVTEFDLDNNNHLIDRIADHVFGQNNLNEDITYPVSRSSVGCAIGLAVDTNRNYLFVSDSLTNRVLVYDTASLSDNMDAIFVLGQTDFANDDIDFGNASAANMTGPLGIDFDNSTGLLYVTDPYFNRVLIFDTATMHNGMDAAYVIGQQDFSGQDADTTQNNFDFPTSVAVDSSHRRLFVVDQYNCRVMVFDTASLSNGEPASHVIGEPDFNTSDECGLTTQADVDYAQDIGYDLVNDRLYVIDPIANRLLIFDTANIVNGEPAVAVLGQPNFTSEAYQLNRYGFDYPQGVAIDSANQLVYVTDNSNSRVMIFDLNINFSKDSLIAGSQNSNYQDQVVASAPYGAFTYSIASGALPPGLSLSADGTISGTPTSSGVYQFVISANNDWGMEGVLSSNKTYSIDISTAPSTPSNAHAPSSGSGESENTAELPTQIVLEELDGFSEDQTVTVDLTTSQVINFSLPSNGSETNSGISTTSHTITVDGIGENYVDLTIASDPIHVRLYVGQLQSIDVDGDGKSDINLSLASISGASAQLIVKKLVPDFLTAAKSPAVTASPATPSVQPNNHLIRTMAVLLVVIGALGVFVYLKNRAKSKVGSQI